jgi:hypothetical protein
MKAGRFAGAETEYRQALPVMDAKSEPLDAAYGRFRMGEVLHKLELVAVSTDRGKPEEAAAFRARLVPAAK